MDQNEAHAGCSARNGGGGAGHLQEVSTLGTRDDRVELRIGFHDEDCLL